MIDADRMDFGCLDRETARKYVLKRRGIVASEAQRKPGGTLSPAARAEVDYLLSRLARADARAGRLAA